MAQVDMDGDLLDALGTAGGSSSCMAAHGPWMDLVMEEGAVGGSLVAGPLVAP